MAACLCRGGRICAAGHGSRSLFHLHDTHSPALAEYVECFSGPRPSGAFSGQAMAPLGSHFIRLATCSGGRLSPRTSPWGLAQF